MGTGTWFHESDDIGGHSGKELVLHWSGYFYWSGYRVQESKEHVTDVQDVGKPKFGELCTILFTLLLLGGFQKRFVRILLGLEGLNYKERLYRFGSFCSELYKIMSSIDKVNSYFFSPG